MHHGMEEGSGKREERLFNGRTPAAVMPAQIEWRLDRALAWAKLRRAPNSAKNLVFTYWSEGGGKDPGEQNCCTEKNN